ncbi:MAG: ribonuclease P protein component [Bacteroidota bacterium]|nr:ribonuclease P protein component [Bacteroidota bacterium]
MRQTFTKDERLCKKSLIARLFKEGTPVFVYPFRALTLRTPLDTKYPCQILIAVPKHCIRKAYCRNLIKRRIREAFRKNKHILYTKLSEPDKQMAICLTYTPKEILPYSLIEEKIIVLLRRLSEGYEVTSR